MIIEIRKAGFINKGAHLMLLAILEQIKTHTPDAKIAMETAYGAAPYIARAQAGFYQKAQLLYRGIQFGKLAEFVPKKVRDTFGVVTDSELSLVLDAAGFAYGDQWGEAKVKELAKASKVWKKNGTKVVLLPQAFGPFKNKNIVKHMKKIIENSDLIYAREQLSFEYLMALSDGGENIRLAPDFTNLISGIVPDYFDSDAKKVAIIPNVKMIEQGRVDTNIYLNFLHQLAQYLVHKNAHPFFLIHEGEGDIRLAEDINKKMSVGLEIVKDKNPLHIKGIISCCDAVVGSRFHGLVSALSQGIPALATGWSHKYEMLFNDYGFPEWMINDLGAIEDVFVKVDKILDDNMRQEFCNNLLSISNTQKQLSRKMWSEVLLLTSDVKG